jgi:thermitase
VGIVAVIDTGVDPNHPALIGVLTPGYDFTRNVSGIPSELDDLDPATAALLTQSVSPFLEGQTIVPINSSALAILSQSVSPFLESALPSAFGHGTMTAGLVHLIAPSARIMPLKTFGANGTGNLSDIIRAIYYAVNHGANVISMSFELPAASPGLRQAMNYAQNRGVVLVAAAGNDASAATVWPAGLSGVLGIGSTSNLDVRSTFSNFGSSDVTFAAPGEGVISTYPGGNYAAGWGTSFSAPLVAGATVLLQQKNPQGGFSWIFNALDKSTVPVQQMNRGRVDLYKALLFQ